MSEYDFLLLTEGFAIGVYYVLIVRCLLGARDARKAARQITATLRRLDATRDWRSALTGKAAP